MLDFCAEHQLYPECETIRMDQVNEAYDRLLKNDVRYRFVIDMAAGFVNRAGARIAVALALSARRRPRRRTRSIRSPSLPAPATAKDSSRKC